ncbi:MAG: hypothetical protein A3H25_07800 [Sphingomonadales bacterium RIFCSPLOWO2_12_FULL_63_15]|nr:MAG: hypothetical protein A3H25_07800 [Sphingomonadales bacterium RIFCSPLOWO2_12_FULL_63_15]
MPVERITRIDRGAKIQLWKIVYARLGKDRSTKIVIEPAFHVRACREVKNKRPDNISGGVAPEQR